MRILGGTTPLNVIIKFPTNKNKENDDEFSEWDEDAEMKKIRQNIGLREIKWIKF